MKRLEAYLQIVIGFVGIVVTLLTAPNIPGLLGHLAAGAPLPQELQGVSGALRMYAIMFALSAMLFLFIMGMTVVFSSITEALGAKNPLHSSGALIGCLSMLALMGTLSVFSSPGWFVPLVAAIFLFLMSVAAAADIAAFWVLCGVGLFITTLAGGVASGPPNPAPAVTTSSSPQSVHKN
jgi:hypothetical protein